MKKITAILAVIFMLALSAGLKAAPAAAKTGVKPPAITSAMMFAEEFQKSGVTGKETSEGILPKIMGILGLRQYREITGHDFSVQIWDFKSTTGFNIADVMFHFFDMLTDVEVYKSRPYIVQIDFESKESHDMIIKSLKKIMPDIKEAGTKEF